MAELIVGETPTKKTCDRTFDAFGKSFHLPNFLYDGCIKRFHAK
jgi:hypothetical protein